MGLNYSTMVYLPNYDMFARPVMFVPTFGAPYGNRGIWHSGATNVQADDGSIFSDQGTSLDIREVEFTAPLPMQGDHVIIGPDGDVPAEGEFVITDVSRNGGGETTLVLSKYVAGKFMLDQSKLGGPDVLG
jgi:hypothetical protein